MGIKKNFQLIISYFQLRFFKSPYLLMPIYLFVFSADQLHQSLILIFLIIFFAMMFFRLFDDVMCADYDILKQKNHFYLNPNDLKVLIYHLFMIGALFTFMIYLISGQIMSVVLLAFILLNIGFYKLLKQNKLITLVSIFKYPLLYYFSAQLTHTFSYTWAILLLLGLLLIEAIQEKFLKLNFSQPKLIIFTIYLLLIVGIKIDQFVL